MQLVLGTHEHVDHHHPVEVAGDTLLSRIQADVRADRPPPGDPLPGTPDARPRLDPNDRSIQIHACHGRARQVEVLRDAILHLLEEDDTLQPRDVIVMCPDIETFAPLIQATFGAAEAVDEDEFAPLPAELRPTDLRVRLADRSLRQTNPVLGVVAQLIDLAGRRLTASDVLDLADREPVRRRFRLEDEDLARIRDWVADSGIRWGLDAAHRAPYKLQDMAAGTWRAGLDRVLVGVTMTEEGHRLFEGVLPVDDVESLAIDLAGRMAELVDRLQAAVDAFGTAKPVGELGQGARDRRRRPHRDLPARRLAARAARAHPRRRRERGRRRRRRRADAARGPRAAGRAAAGAPDARELPHRPPDHLHARADALGAAPGRLPARPRRRRVPAQGPARRRRHHARRPARRRPRPAPRGPPDAARRADGGERPPDRQLLGQRRPHEHAAPARGAGGRAARHDRPHRAGRRARAGARPPPAPALRPAQLQARRARRRRRLELQPRHARRRARDGAGARRAAAVPGRARCRRCPSPCSSSRTSSPSSAIPCGRSCASGSASASGPTTTRSPTRSRSSSTASSRGRSVSGCSRRASRARRPTRRSGRSAPAASSRPACSPTRSSRSSCPTSSRSSATPPRCCRTAPPRDRSTCASRSRTAGG